MKIEGLQFFNYDPKHIQILRQELAQSIKPNVLRDMGDEVAMALVLSDAVSLSPEAKAILRKLRAELSKDPKISAKDRQELERLFYTYKEVRDVVYGKQEEEGERLFLPIQIPLSQPEGEKKRGKSAAEELVEKMIVFSPRPELKKLLAQELGVLGENMISAVKQFGTRIIILGRNQVMSQIKIAGMTVVAKGEKTFDGRDWDNVRGIYDSERRIIMLGEEMIARPEFSAGRHEFAHAFDHTFTVKNQRRLPLSVQLWNLFRGERQELISGYAGTNPAEYFAECVEAFFRKESRAKLEANDPKMFQYLENLFGS
jgi:hypothetical protein